MLQMSGSGAADGLHKLWRLWGDLRQTQQDSELAVRVLLKVSRLLVPMCVGYSRHVQRAECGGYILQRCTVHGSVSVCKCLAPASEKMMHEMCKSMHARMHSCTNKNRPFTHTGVLAHDRGGAACAVIFARCGTRESACFQTNTHTHRCVRA
jgi:hypothetical protein